jgi:hypothetical protein
MTIQPFTQLLRTLPSSTFHTFLPWLFLSHSTSRRPSSPRTTGSLPTSVPRSRMTVRSTPRAGSGARTGVSRSYPHLHSLSDAISRRTGRIAAIIIFLVAVILMDIYQKTIVRVLEPTAHWMHE